MSSDSRYDLHALLDNLLARLTGPAGPELTCEQCFDGLDRYVELELDGSGADTAIPRMRAHLEGCSACAEDRESLRALLSAMRAQAPDKTRRRRLARAVSHAGVLREFGSPPRAGKVREVLLVTLRRT